VRRRLARSRCCYSFTELMPSICMLGGFAGACIASFASFTIAESGNGILDLALAPVRVRVARNRATSTTTTVARPCKDSGHLVKCYFVSHKKRADVPHRQAVASQSAFSNGQTLRPPRFRPTREKNEWRAFSRIFEAATSVIVSSKPIGNTCFADALVSRVRVCSINESASDLKFV
jgi:hypothetical protein